MRSRFAIFTLLFLTFAISGCAAEKAGRHPTILVTDIGTDIDDTWALALLLRSPELDLKFILADPADTTYRAQVAAKFLQAAGRTDVIIGLGDNTGTKAADIKTMTPWVYDYTLDQYPGVIARDGITAMIELIEKSRETVTVIATGPAHSLAMALKRSPKIASKCRLIAMYGSFNSGYEGGPPTADMNVKIEPAAVRTVLSAPWRDVLLTPLDTAALVRLEGKNYNNIWSATGDPMIRALIESYCIFAPRQVWMKCDFFTTRSTTLFDCVTVYAAFSERFLEIQEVSFEITEDGSTRSNPQGPHRLRVALYWKGKDQFESEITSRLLVLNAPHGE